MKNIYIDNGYVYEQLAEIREDGVSAVCIGWLKDNQLILVNPDHRMVNITNT